MFNQQASLPSGVNKGSPISQSLSLLSTAIGIAAAILLTPLLYGVTRGILYAYLASQWGADLAAFLTGMMGVLEGVLIFSLTRLGTSITAMAVIVGLAARRIPHS